MRLRFLRHLLFFFPLVCFSVSVFAEVPKPAVKIQKLYTLEVQGPALFIQKTKEALDLLARARQIDMVKRYVKVIRAGERSGMRANENPPVYEVGMPTWNHSALWYAGTIAHDAYHSKLYQDEKTRLGGKEPAPDVWTGKEAERACLKFQYQVLKSLGADQRTLEYVQALEKNPTYQGDPASKEDYLKRNW